jgi:hypothetical protein
MDLLVHPKSVWLIVYPGGYCGEFLAWWLSLHPGCIRTGNRGIGKNRYIGQHDRNYVYSEQGSRDLLFLTTHPNSGGVSKIGFVVSDIDQHMTFYASKRTHRFYFLLYLIKTVFYKHTVAHPPLGLFESSKHWEDFVRHYLRGRVEFTGTEVMYWLKGLPYKDPPGLVADAWRKAGTWPRMHGPRNYDIDGLFFGDYAQSYADLCSRFNITPQDRLNHYVPEYHQRNVELVESYINMPLQEFLDLDEDTAMTVITQAMLKRSAEPHSFV